MSIIFKVFSYQPIELRDISCRSRVDVESLTVIGFMDRMISVQVAVLCSSAGLSHIKHPHCLLDVLFVWFKVLHLSQQLWSCKDSQFA